MKTSAFYVVSINYCKNWDWKSEQDYGTIKCKIMIGGIGLEFNFLESLLFGFAAGLTDILPVSAQAHRTILMTIFGADGESPLLRLLTHGAILAALYYCCQKQIRRISRQLKLALIPKKRRKRPVDMRTLLDFKLLRTMMIPAVLGFLFYQKAASLNGSLSWIALFALVNAVILFLPRLLPTGNKDSRSMSRVEAMLMGLGGAAGIFPGISSMGVMTSVASVCGAEKQYGLTISLMMNMVITVMLVFFDFLAIVSVGIGTFSFAIFFGYLLAAGAAFAGVVLGERIMRAIAANIGTAVFAWYSLAVAFLSFILYLML